MVRGNSYHLANTRMLGLPLQGMYLCKYHQYLDGSRRILYRSYQSCYIYREGNVK
jgi:hypothetical protein